MTDGHASSHAVTGRTRIENLTIGMGFLVTVMGGAIAVGSGSNRLSNLESTAAQRDDIQRLRTQQLEDLNTKYALLEARCRSLEESNHAKERRIAELATTVAAVGDIVLVMCETGRRRDMICKVRQ